MKFRGLGLMVLAAVVLIVVVHFARPLLTEQTESRCDQGDLLETARLLDPAQEAFIGAAAEGERCGEEGLPPIERKQATAARKFTRARVLGAVPKQTNAAINLYAGGLARNPFDTTAGSELSALLEGLPVAKTGPVSLARCRQAARLTKAGLLSEAGTVVANGLAKAPRYCRQVLGRLTVKDAIASKRLRLGDRLASEGETDEARQRYALALRANPALSDAQTSLEGSFDFDRRLDDAGSWLAGVPASVDKALDWLVPLLVLLLVFAVAIWFAIRSAASNSAGAYRWLNKRGKEPGLSFLRKAAVPQLSVADFDGGESGVVGKDFSFLLDVALSEKEGDDPAFAIDRVGTGSGDDQAAAAMAALFAEVPKAKLAGSIVKLLSLPFRRRSIRVCGHLSPITDQGAGVTLRLEGGGMDSESSIALWEHTFDPEPGGKGAARWLRLVPAATVWVRRQLAAKAWPETKLDPDGWLPDALFQSAVQWQAQGNWSRAEALYTDALERNPGLLPAAHNLSVM